MNEVQYRYQVLYMAMELSEKTWGLAFLNGSTIRRVKTAAGDREPVLLQVSRAKAKLGYDPDAPVRCCYEAGRDGFWIHRWLHTIGIDNKVVDSASLEVSRRRRQATTDRIDAEKLVRQLVRYWELGGRQAVRVVRVPSGAARPALRHHHARPVLPQESAGIPRKGTRSEEEAPRTAQSARRALRGQKLHARDLK